MIFLPLVNIYLPLPSKGRFRVRVSDLYLHATFDENSLFDLAAVTAFELQDLL